MLSNAVVLIKPFRIADFYEIFVQNKPFFKIWHIQTLLRRMLTLVLFHKEISRLGTDISIANINHLLDIDILSPTLCEQILWLAFFLGYRLWKFCPQDTENDIIMTSHYDVIVTSRIIKTMPCWQISEHNADYFI